MIACKTGFVAFYFFKSISNNFKAANLPDHTDIFLFLSTNTM